MMDDLAQRAEIKRYVDTAFIAKVLRMNDVREERKLDRRRHFAVKGHSPNSNSCVLAEVDIEEECIAELLHQKGDLYLEAYNRKGLKIGPDVLRDLSETQMHTIGVRKSMLMAEAQLTAVRTGTNSKAHFFAHLGRKASVTIKEIEAKIGLHNLTPSQSSEPVTMTNINYHLSGVGNRIVHGDDHSVTIINERELFDGLAATITSAVQTLDERSDILATLDELKQQKTKTDYLALVPKFITAASSIGHLIAPYLSALVERAESLVSISKP
jgi:hypothetical protein